MTIARRLIILLAVPLTALVGLGVVTRLQLSKLEEASRYVAENQIPGLAVIGNATRAFVYLRVNVRSYLLATSPASRDKARSEFDAGEAELTRLLGHYADELISDEQNRRMLGEYQDAAREWIAGGKQVMSLAEAGRRDDAAALLEGPVTMVGNRLNKASASFKVWRK